MAEKIEIAKVDPDGVQFGGTLAGVSVSREFLLRGGFTGGVRPEGATEVPSQDIGLPVFQGRRPSDLQPQKKEGAA